MVSKVLSEALTVFLDMISAVMSITTMIRLAATNAAPVFYWKTGIQVEPTSIFMLHNHPISLKMKSLFREEAIESGNA